MPGEDERHHESNKYRELLSLRHNPPFWVGRYRMQIRFDKKAQQWIIRTVENRAEVQYSVRGFQTKLNRLLAHDRKLDYFHRTRAVISANKKRTPRSH